jgi:hypothetical protein
MATLTAAAKSRRLRPIQPNLSRDLVLQAVVLLTPLVLTLGAIRLGDWWFIAAGFTSLITLLLAFLTLSQLSGIRPRPYATRRGDIRTFLAASNHVHVVLAGFAAGPQVFAAAAANEEPEARSYARGLLDRGESVMLFFLDRGHLANRPVTYVFTYDERVLFRQLHLELQELANRTIGPLQVNLHAHSSSSGFVRRYLAWLQTKGGVHYQIEGEHYLNPAAKLRFGQIVLTAIAHLYKGNPVLQWAWFRGLHRVVLPPNKAAIEQCVTDNRQIVSCAMEYAIFQVSVAGMLGRLRALQLDRSFSFVGQRPFHYVLLTSIPKDKVVDNKGNQEAFDCAFAWIYDKYVLLGAGPHGIIGEYPAYYGLAGKYIDRRNAWRP